MPALLVAASGCPKSNTPADNDGGGADATVPLSCKLDLLVVVDDSSALPSLLKLSNTLARVLEQLVTGDDDLDGNAEAEPVESIHLGVISMDMGGGAIEVAPNCPVGPGEDGLLQNAGDPGVSDCGGPYPRVLEFRQPDAPDSLVEFARCVVPLGMDGCGIEQPLEATLKALTPSDSSIEFLFGHGHGTDANSSFLRSDSFLAFLFVTDEDDISANDSRLFDPDPENELYPGPLTLRAMTYPNALYSLERYVSGFLALRLQPARLGFGAVVGIPPDPVQDPNDIDYAMLLSEPAMQLRAQSDAPSQLETSCEYDQDGDGVEDAIAFPPRRIVGMAQALASRGAVTMVDSICQPSFSEDALRTFLRRLSASSCQ